MPRLDLRVSSPGKPGAESPLTFALPVGHAGCLVIRRTVTTFSGARSITRRQDEQRLQVFLAR